MVVRVLMLVNTLVMTAMIVVVSNVMAAVIVRVVRILSIMALFLELKMLLLLLFSALCLALSMLSLKLVLLVGQISVKVAMSESAIVFNNGMFLAWLLLLSSLVDLDVAHAFFKEGLLSPLLPFFVSASLLDEVNVSLVLTVALAVALMDLLVMLVDSLEIMTVMRLVCDVFMCHNRLEMVNEWFVMDMKRLMVNRLVMVHGLVVNRLVVDQWGRLNVRDHRLSMVHMMHWLDMMMALVSSQVLLVVFPVSVGVSRVALISIAVDKVVSVKFVVNID